MHPGGGVRRDSTRSTVCDSGVYSTMELTAAANAFDMLPQLRFLF